MLLMERGEDARFPTAEVSCTQKGALLYEILQKRLKGFFPMFICQSRKRKDES